MEILIDNSARGRLYYTNKHNKFLYNVSVTYDPVMARSKIGMHHVSFACIVALSWLHYLTQEAIAHCKPLRLMLDLK